MQNNKDKELTGQEKVEYYLNVWGSDKKSLLTILRQLIFIIGIVTTAFVAIWVVTNALSYYYDNAIFTTVVKHTAMISIIFIAFIIVLDHIYLFAELFSFNSKRLNRVPSMIMGGLIVITLLVFSILTCYELFGPNKAEKSYLYCIYLVICFSACLFSTIYCFDASKTKQKYHPNNKLIKTLSYTIGFLGILVILVYIPFIMWYVGGNEKLLYTCFLLGRTLVTLVGSIILKVACLIGLNIYIKNDKYKKTRIIWLSIILAVLLGLEIYACFIFVNNGIYQTEIMQTKIIITLLSVLVIVVSASNIAIASRYSTRLEKEEK